MAGADRSLSHVAEKATIDPSDYEGLQLDTRAKEQTEKHVDSVKSPQSPGGTRHMDYSDEKAFISEREAREAQQKSPYSLTSTQFSPKPAVIDDLTAPPKPKVPRICGMRRKYFWALFGTVLAIIIIAAVLGGVLGSTSHTTTTSAGPSTAATPNSPPSALPGVDVAPASPLVPVAYTLNQTAAASAGNPQSYRIYFQSLYGSIKELPYQGQWQDAMPIFTDAKNNTGLAAITYLNGTFQQTTLFYTGSNGYVQEKRNYGGGLWEPGTLDGTGLTLTGNIQPQGSETTTSKDPSNNWDSYRMAAVYSTKFGTGPGARFFIHQLQSSGQTFVQEMIWHQSNDSWTYGSQFPDVWPTSHLTATIDETSGLLRLFYSAGNLTLAESYTNITESQGVYHKGVSIPNYLANDDGDLAAVTFNGSTLVYHYPKLDPQAIHELNITGIPGSPNNQETYNLTAEPIVFHPALLTNNNQWSAYQPLTAITSTVNNTTPFVSVFWADENINPTSGYGALKLLNRNASVSWPSSSYNQSSGTVVRLPFGSDNI